MWSRLQPAEKERIPVDTHRLAPLADVGVMNRPTGMQGRPGRVSRALVTTNDSVNRRTPIRHRSIRKRVAICHVLDMQYDAYDC